MATFDIASNIVVNLYKLLETMYDCSESVTFSISSITKPETLSVTTVDSFSSSQHIGTVPIHVREAKPSLVHVTVPLNKLTKSLKKSKGTAVRFLIVSGESLLVTPSNDPDTVIYAKESIYDLCPTPTEEKVLSGLTESVGFTLLLSDLANIVINLCVGSGFVSFKTYRNRLSMFTKTPSTSVHVDKLIQGDIPDFETVIVLKLLKVLTHSSLPSAKEVVCYVPTGKNIPLRFCICFSQCTLTTLLYDQTEYM